MIQAMSALEYLPSSLKLGREGIKMAAIDSANNTANGATSLIFNFFIISGYFSSNLYKKREKVTEQIIYNYLSYDDYYTHSIKNQIVMFIIKFSTNNLDKIILNNNKF